MLGFLKNKQNFTRQIKKRDLGKDYAFSYILNYFRIGALSLQNRLRYN